MSRGNILFWGYAMLTFVVAYFMTSLYIENRNLYQVIDKTSNSLSNFESLQSNLENRIAQQLTHDSKKVFETTQLTSGKSKLYIRAVIGNSNKTIFRIPEHTCDICYDDIMMQIKAFAKEIDTGKVLVIVEVKKLREYRNFFKEENINVTVFGLESKFNLELENGYAPYFFMLDSTLTIKHLFIPGKQQNKLTTDYLAIIKSRYY